MREVEGNLNKVKEDPRNIVYEIETDIQGLRGSVYLDKSRLPLFNRLILTKKEITK